MRSIEHEKTHSYKGFADVPQTPQVIDAVYRTDTCADPANDPPPASDDHGAVVAPDSFVVAVNTSVGSFEVEATRSWAPHGVDRFYELCILGYYNDTRVYRMVDTWVAQFGVSGAPAVAAEWADRHIPDDPIQADVHNDEGYLTFSATYNEKTGVATNRTTELFFNLEDHREIDPLGFPPIGLVRGEGMAVVHRFFAGYGEMKDTCDLHGFSPCEGPNNTCVYDGGNACLDHHFPNLTRIYSISVVEEHVRRPSHWDPLSANGSPAAFTGRDMLFVFCSLALIALVAMVSVVCGGVGRVSVFGFSTFVHKSSVSPGPTSGAWQCLARLHSQYCRNPKGKYTAFPADGSTNPMHGGTESDSDEGALTDSDDDGEEEGGLELTNMHVKPPGDDV